MVEIRSLGLDGVMEITPRRFGDARGWFAETWSATALADAGLLVDWVQDNQAYCASAGVVRGLHLQCPPFAQSKLVRAIRGSAFDVAVDVRTDSPDFGKWISVVLSAERGNQIFVPKGFAHGYMSLEPETEIAYKVNAPYAPGHERRIAWNDPAIGITWPAMREILLGDRDRDAPALAQTDIGCAVQ